MERKITSEGLRVSKIFLLVLKERERQPSWTENKLRPHKESGQALNKKSSPNLSQVDSFGVYELVQHFGHRPLVFAFEVRTRILGRKEERGKEDGEVVRRFRAKCKNH